MKATFLTDLSILSCQKTLVDGSSVLKSDIFVKYRNDDIILQPHIHSRCYHWFLVQFNENEKGTLVFLKYKQSLIMRIIMIFYWVIISMFVFYAIDGVFLSFSNYDNTDIQGIVAFALIAVFTYGIYYLLKRRAFNMSKEFVETKLNAHLTQE